MFPGWGNLCASYVGLGHGAASIRPGRGTMSSVPDPVRVRPSRAQEPPLTHWLWWGVDTKAHCTPGLLELCVRAAPVVRIALSTGEVQTRDPSVPRGQPLPGLWTLLAYQPGSGVSTPTLEPIPSVPAGLSLCVTSPCLRVDQRLRPDMGV